jgi:beta-phosphoglucomutase-like phosphatase (HAD superfamily)
VNVLDAVMLDLDGVLVGSEPLCNDAKQPTGDALALAAATVESVAEVTPELVERVGQGVEQPA